MTRMPRASSTSWNRSRSPVTTSTGSGERAARVPITSSASNPGCPAMTSPDASSTSSISGTCAASAGGTSSPPSAARRCALYDGTAWTRKAGRQSASQHATSRAGCRARTSRVIMSSSPRTALTGVPSGAWTVSGTPKNARKYSEAVSSNMSEPTLPSNHAGRGALDQQHDLAVDDLDLLLGQRAGSRAGHHRAVGDLEPAAMAGAVDGAAGHLVHDAAHVGADRTEGVVLTADRLGHDDPRRAEDHAGAHRDLPGGAERHLGDPGLLPGRTAGLRGRG